MNQIKELPNSIGNLRNLTSLQIYGNKIKELPNSIKNLKNLDEFSKKGLEGIPIKKDIIRPIPKATPWYKKWLES